VLEKHEPPRTRETQKMKCLLKGWLSRSTIHDRNGMDGCRSPTRSLRPLADARKRIGTDDGTE